MKKYLLVLVAAAMLAIGTYATSSKTFALTEQSSSGAYGTASILATSLGDFESLVLKVWVKNLTPMQGYVYEGWLVDDDTGYKLSTGALQTTSQGIGWQQLSMRLVNIGLYDRYVLTMEPINDTNPNPNIAVLAGMIP